MPTLVRATAALAIVGGALFAFAGADIVFRGAERGDVRISLGGAGFFYTWLQIYATSFLLAIVAYCQRSLGNRKTALPAVAYVLGLAIGLMSGYKFTTVLVFLPAVTIALVRFRVLPLALLSAAALGVILIGEVSQSGRQIDEALAYVAARSTSVAAYGVVGSWNEFADQGASWSRFEDSCVLWLGAKVAAVVSGYSEDSFEFLKFNLSRYLTYLYYPDALGAITGTVNLTITVFGEAVSIFGGRWFWVWSILSGAVIGWILRAYRHAAAAGSGVQASLWLVYYFSIALTWINSSGWINLISIPAIVGMLALSLMLAPLVVVRPRPSGATQTVG